MTTSLPLLLGMSAALFSLGLMAVLSRRHAIFILIGIEMMLTAANLNFIAFWRYSPQPQPIQPTGVMFAIFSIAIAAAEAAVGLGFVIAVYRHYKTAEVSKLNKLKG